MQNEIQINPAEIISEAVSVLKGMEDSGISLYSYWKMYVLDCVLISDNRIPTACVGYDRNLRKIELRYSPNFVHRVFQKMGKNRDKTVLFMFLVLLHELEHVRRGHLLIKEEEIGKKFNVPLRIMNVAADYEVNQSINELLVDLPTRVILKEVTDKFIETGAFPTGNEVESCNRTYGNAIGNFFYWCGIINSNPQEGDPQEGDPQEGDPQEGDPQEDGFSRKGAATGDVKFGSMRKEDLEDLESDIEEPGTGSTEAEKNSIVISPSHQKNKGAHAVKELVKFYEGLAEKNGAYTGYFSPHILNITGIIDRRYKLPTVSIGEKVRTLFFVDVSGSMDMGTLCNVYGVLEEIIKELGEAHFVACSTEIKDEGIIQENTFSQNCRLLVGGGTAFEETVYEFADRGFDHFIFYTDGRISDAPFEFPKNINPDEQAWVLVGHASDPRMGGIKIYLD